MASSLRIPLTPGFSSYQRPWRGRRGVGGLPLGWAPRQRCRLPEGHRPSTPSPSTTGISASAGVEAGGPGRDVGFPPGQSGIMIKFALQGETALGERHAIVGNLPELGAWNVTGALPLEWTEGHVWRGFIVVPPGTEDCEFKCVKLKPDGDISWQTGDNFLVEISDKDDVIVDVCCWWGSDDFYVEFEDAADPINTTKVSPPPSASASASSINLTQQGKQNGKDTQRRSVATTPKPARATGSMIGKGAKDEDEVPLEENVSIKAAQEMLQKKEEELEEYRLQSQKSAQKIGDLQGLLDELKESHESLQAEWERGDGELTAALFKQLAETGESLESERQAHFTLQENAQKWAESRAALGDAVQKAADENSGLSSLLKKTQQELEYERAVRAEEFARWEKERKQLQYSLDMLSSMGQDSSDMVDAAIVRAADDYSALVEELQGSVEALEVAETLRREEAEKWEQERNELQSSLELLREEKAQAKQDLRKAADEASSLWEESKESLTEAFKQAAIENSALTNKLRKSQRAVESEKAKREKDAAELERLKSKLATLKEDKAQVEAALHALVKESSGLSKQLEQIQGVLELEEKAKISAGKTGTSGTDSANADKLQRRMSEAKRRARELEKELSVQTARALGADTELEQLRASEATLQEKVEAAEQFMQGQAAQIAVLEDQLTLSQSDLELEQRAKGVLADKNVYLKKNTLRLEKDVRESRSALEQSVRVRNELELEIGFVRDRLMQERKRSRSLAHAMGAAGWSIAKAELQDMILSTRAEAKDIAAKTNLAKINLSTSTASVMKEEARVSEIQDNVIERMEEMRFAIEQQAAAELNWEMEESAHTSAIAVAAPPHQEEMDVDTIIEEAIARRDGSEGRSVVANGFLGWAETEENVNTGLRLRQREVKKVEQDLTKKISERKGVEARLRAVQDELSKYRL